MTASLEDVDAFNFARLATQELILHGAELGDRGDAARDRARTWAILALAQANEALAMAPESQRP